MSISVDPSRASRRVRALSDGPRTQFNAVVETNIRAVEHWRSPGFSVVGTVPEAFALPGGG